MRKNQNPTKYNWRKTSRPNIEVWGWIGPRGKQLIGTGKALARLIWDRKRLS